jgi:hypothetical protein
MYPLDEAHKTGANGRSFQQASRKLYFKMVLKGLDQIYQ